MKKLLIFLLSLALTGIFVSCNDGIDSDSEALRASADGKTYLVIGGASLGRTVLTPKTASKEDLANFSLTGTFEDETEAVTFVKAEEALTLEELGNKKIEIEAGNWTFTLSAELNSIPFSDTKSIEIKAGVVNTLSFDLKADSSYGGGISVTLNFPLDKSINSVVAKFSDPSGSNEIETKTFELADFAEVKDTDGEVKEYSVTYSRNLSEEASRISAGSYYLVFDFMAEGTRVPINSFPYYVRVVSGFTSSAVDSVKLNETYSITYSYFANGEALEATDSSIGIADSPEGFVFPAKYSRKSDTISLPAMAKTVTEGEAGYAFAGWFEDADFTKPITEIASGSTGNKTLYAAFINRITVSANGKADASVVSGAVDSIGTAITKIESYEATDVDWTILIDGKVVLEGLQLTVSSSYAKSLTFAGLHENSGNDYIDSIDGGVVGATNADAIDGSILVIVEYCVPVTVKNLKVTHGGRAFENKGKLTLDDGAWITDNHSWMAGGINNCNSAILTMKEGSRITNNSASNWGGGICNTATVIMEGGEISGNVSPYGAGVCHYGTDFIISGNASIPVGDDPENPQDFYLMADSSNGAYPITVAGEHNPVYLTFGGAYDRYTGNVLLRTSEGLELTSDIISKFQIEQPESVDYEWVISLDGKLAKKSTEASGTASTDSRALSIMIYEDEPTLYLNSSLSFIATDEFGNTVSGTDDNPLSWTATILYKGEDVNSILDSKAYTYTTAGSVALTPDTELPEGSYQLYVTVSQPVNSMSGNTVSSSQTFTINVKNEYCVQKSPIVLYNYNDENYDFYEVKDTEKEPLETALFSEGLGSTAFDANGNFYIYSNKTVKSSNSKFPADGVSLESILESSNNDFTIDLAKNVLYAYEISSNSNSLTLYQFKDLIANGSDGDLSDNYKLYNIDGGTFTPQKCAVNKNILYVYGETSGSTSIKAYNLASASYSNSTKEIDCDSLDEVGSAYKTITEMFAQDECVYLMVSDQNFRNDATNFYSRGAILKVDFTENSVALKGWTSDTNSWKPKAGSYLYTYFVEGDTLKNTYQYHTLGTVAGTTVQYPVLLGFDSLNDGIPQFYTPSDETKAAFFGPQRIIALRPKELVIADEGVVFYTDSLGAYKFRNVNRIVTVNLEEFAITSVKEASVGFSNDNTEAFPGGCKFASVPSGSLYVTDGGTPVAIEKAIEANQGEALNLYYHASSFVTSGSVFSNSAISYAFPCGDDESNDGE